MEKKKEEKKLLVVEKWSPRDINLLAECKIMNISQSIWNEEHRKYKDRDPTLYPDGLILVSGPDANEPEEKRQVSSQIKLSDGSILILLTTVQT